MRFKITNSVSGRLRRAFTAHPESVGETYFEHFRVAAYFSGQLAKAALACACHAFLPAIHKTTASRIIRALHERMVVNRARSAGVAPESAAGAASLNE